MFNIRLYGPQKITVCVLWLELQLKLHLKTWPGGKKDQKKSSYRVRVAVLRCWDYVGFFHHRSVFFGSWSSIIWLLNDDSMWSTLHSQGVSPWVWQTSLMSQAQTWNGEIKAGNLPKSHHSERGLKSKGPHILRGEAFLILILFTLYWNPCLSLGRL